jgi:hypothetical protein
MMDGMQSSSSQLKLSADTMKLWPVPVPIPLSSSLPKRTCTLPYTFKTSPTYLPINHSKSLPHLELISCSGRHMKIQLDAPAHSHSFTFTPLFI